MDQDTSASDSQLEVNFDGLRNAITPINLMFDGRLFKDLKGLTSHITQAMKKVDRERPDYQAALVEINLLEAAFNSALMQWEQKLTGEIQRLKSSVETSQQKSLGATKKISKYQEELTRGRATTRTMPIRIGQVRNQLIYVSGHGTNLASANVFKNKSKLAEQKQEFPTVYKKAVEQILRKVNHKGDSKFTEIALRVFKNLSKPPIELDDKQEIFRGKLYYLNPSSAVDDPKLQFVTINGSNQAGDSYTLESVFADSSASFEMRCEEFHRLRVDLFEPLEDMQIILRLLKAKFRDDDFPETFKLYAAIRQKALENKRDEKFSPRQQAIHDYLTDLVFKFVGISFDNYASEVRFTEQVNQAIQMQ